MSTPLSKPVPSAIRLWESEGPHFGEIKKQGCVIQRARGTGGRVPLPSCPPTDAVLESTHSSLCHIRKKNRGESCCSPLSLILAVVGKRRTSTDTELSKQNKRHLGHMRPSVTHTLTHSVTLSIIPIPRDTRDVQGIHTRKGHASKNQQRSR